MLEALVHINRSELSHTYGEASEVREEARHELYGNIWHQGTAYEATAFAGPFLIELARDVSVQGRDQLLPGCWSVRAGRDTDSSIHRCARWGSKAGARCMN